MMEVGDKLSFRSVALTRYLVGAPDTRGRAEARPSENQQVLESQ